MTRRLVDVVLEDDGWADLNLEDLAETSARRTLVHLGLVPAEYEISLLAGSDARIAQLNAEFRDKPVPTNVLSWPSEERSASVDGESPVPPVDGDADDPAELGDIALARETCLAEARSAGRDPAQHLCHLIVHGVLHLLGYDHERDKDAALMERLEVEILEQLGIPSPYSDDGALDPP